MIHFIKIMAVLAVIAAVVGTFSVYNSGSSVDLAFAQEHDGGGSH